MPVEQPYRPHRNKPKVSCGDISGKMHVCVLPNLSKVASTGISGLRIEGQLDPPSTVEIITRVYRKAIDTLKAGQLVSITSELEEIKNATGRALSDGPFDFQTVTAGTKEQNLVTT